MKSFYWLICVLICGVLLVSCQGENTSRAGWQKVFKNAPDGTSLYGSKSDLIDAVRLGYPIRIGWGSNRIEHVADASFLTVFDDKEVFAQIESIIGQAPAVENDSLFVRFRMENNWTKISGSNGYAMGFMTNYFQDTISGGGFDRYNATTWYVMYPEHTLNIEPTPLWRESSPNWEKYNEEKK